MIRPAAFSLGGLIFLVPYVANLGSPAFRRWVLDNLIPDPKIQRFKGIVDYMAGQAKILIAKKRLALVEGGDAVAQQVGDGKDIMSILCTYFPHSDHDFTFLMESGQYVQTWPRQIPKSSPKRSFWDK